MVNTEIRLIIFFAAKDVEALYSQKKQDWELAVTQIMNSLLPNSDLNWRKWGKPLDHSDLNETAYYWVSFDDLNETPYYYTGKVRNKFKGLNLIGRVPEELWMEVHDVVQEAELKTIPKKKKCKKAKCLSGEPLQIVWREGKWKAKEKRKDIPIWMQSSKE